MSKQQGTPRRSVALAAAFLVLSSTAFGASFYLLDGARYVETLAEQVSEQVAALLGNEAAEEPIAVPVERPAATLVLPPAMSEEFALRIWQEQLNSQQTIEHLVSGNVRSLKVAGVERDGDEARLDAKLLLKDGSTLPGVIGMRRYGGVWYVSYATARQRDRAGAPDNQPLPSLDDVDIPLLNTIIAEQRKSDSVTAAYVDGSVKEVRVERVTNGPQTATIELEMDGDGGEGYGSLVAIRHDAGGESRWFLARFTEAVGEHDTAQ